MRFISREKSPSFALKLAEENVIQTNMGNILRRTNPAWIRFQELDAPFNSSLLPTKNGFANGFLDSKMAVASLSRDGHEFKDSEGRDVTEREVISFLLGHPDYGVYFVAIDDEGGEILPENRDVIPEGGGSMWCRLCKKHLDARGASMHIRESKEHAQLLSLENIRRDRALTA